MSAPAAALAPAARLAAAGFDVLHAFDAHAAAREPALAWLGGGPRAGVLVGNTRALWPAFTAARAADPALAAAADPLDRYCERELEAAFAAAPGARLYFVHRPYGGAYLPFQRLAVATGFGALAPSHLVIHPRHGPWFALRAVALVEGEPPPPAAPIAQPCRCGPACTAALEAARAARGPEAWRAWVAVRDACALPAARDSRYSDDQIRYHYARPWAARGVDT